VDQVRPHWKPHAGVGQPAGIKVISDAGGATLRIEGNLMLGDPPVAYEGIRRFEVQQSTATNTRINALDINTQVDGDTNLGDA
jgi:hypothetical protein